MIWFLILVEILISMIHQYHSWIYFKPPPHNFEMSIKRFNKLLFFFSGAFLIDFCRKLVDYTGGVDNLQVHTLHLLLLLFTNVPLVTTGDIVALCDFCIARFTLCLNVRNTPDTSNLSNYYLTLARILAGSLIIEGA